ncbi:MAG: methyltransferase domain-containing protein [Parvularculaceae bacterium]
MNEPKAPRIFNRRRWARARARASRGFSAFDFLHRRAFADVIDRLESASRSFDDALIYGAGDLASTLTPKAEVNRYALADIAAERLPLEPDAARAVFDEERSPLAAGRFDLIVSLLTLHAANDLIGALAQYRVALKPDGLFIAALFGEETLRALRAALYTAETELAGGVSPRIAPFATLKDLGAALQRAGFALPVADVDNVEVRYEEPQRLISDIRGMGEAGFFDASRRPLTRDLLAAALQQFERAGGVERFDIVYLTGWAPHPGQQKPLQPGSAAHSLERAVRERRS